jgi:hypothetical protein
MTQHADVLPVYLRSRQAMMPLSHKLVATLDKQDLDEGARRLGILKGDVMVFDSEDEAPVLMDYCIYNVYRDGRNAVQRYLADSPPRAGSEELYLLQAMKNARYSLFKIKAPEPGVGATIEDILTGTTDFLADVGISKTVSKGLILASRMIPLEGFLATGGTALPVELSALEEIVRKLERMFNPDTDFAHLSAVQEADLAATVIGTCIRQGVFEHVRYLKPGASLPNQGRRSREPERASQNDRSISQQGYRRGEGERVRANRNDPCPCGSGRKYKSCCGRR